MPVPGHVDSISFSYDTNGNMVNFIWTIIIPGDLQRTDAGSFTYANNLPVSGSFTDNLDATNEKYHYIISANKITAIINQANDTVQKFVYKGDDAVEWIQPNDTIRLNYDNNKSPLFNTDNKWMLLPRIYSNTYIIPVGGMHNVVLNDEHDINFTEEVRNSFLYNTEGYPTHADNHILEDGRAYETVDYNYQFAKF